MKVILKSATVLAVSVTLASSFLYACGSKKKTTGAQDPAKETPALNDEPNSVETEKPDVSSGLSPDQIATEEKNIPKATPGASTCKQKACFTLGKYNLAFGQIKASKPGEVSKDKAEYVYFDQFENKDNRTKEQNDCLQRLSETLKNYAEKNPLALDQFAAAGYGTKIIARVYDYTTNSRLTFVAPAFYLVVNKDEAPSRAEWVIRASIKPKTLSCELPDEKTITAGLTQMETTYLKKK